MWILSLSVFIACLFVTVQSACTPTGPNLVLNGDFEDISNDCYFDFAYYDNCGIASPNDNSTLLNWDVTEGMISAIKSPKWQSQSGVIALGLVNNNNGKIAQLIKGLNIGTRYQLSFWMAGNYYAGTPIKTMNVAFSNLINDNATFDITGATAANMMWNNRFYEFIATASSGTLSFANIEDVWGAALDTVSIQACIPTTTQALTTASLTSASLTSASLTTSRLTTAPALTLQRQVEIFCATAPASSFGSSGNGYYCFNNGAGYGQCYVSGSTQFGYYFACAGGTSCQCAAGVECSNGGLSAPCTLNP